MQHIPEHKEKKESMKSQLFDIYEQRVPLSDVFNAEHLSQPSSLDSAIDRLKRNSIKFAFWYISTIVSFNFLFIFFNKLFLLPIVITVGSIYIASISQTIYNVEITYKLALSVCVVLQLFLCIFSRHIAASYVYFLALNGLAVLVVFAHGIIFTSDEERSSV